MRPSYLYDGNPYAWEDHLYIEMGPWFHLWSDMFCVQNIIACLSFNAIFFMMLPHTSLWVPGF